MIFTDATFSTVVIPAQAGIQLPACAGCEMDPSLRWDDTELVGRAAATLLRSEPR